MAMPYYVSPEQMMQDKAEYARKGISRGRSTIAMAYEGGILLLADNASTLKKISEIYDRIAFAGAGKFSEFENLRKAGIRHADMKGYMYSREDVTGRALANAYSETVGNVFSQEMKPLEVEIMVVELGIEGADNEIYRIQFDGSIQDQKDFAVVGGKADVLSDALKEQYKRGSLKTAVSICLKALEKGNEKVPDPEQLEVAVLDKNRKGRRFRRLEAKEVAKLCKT